MATFSQSLTVPSNVVAGGTIQAGDVTTLYNSLNALTIPDTIASLLVSAYSTDSAITVNGPSTASGASAVSSSTAAFATSKAFIHLGTFSWASTGKAFSLQFRKNGSTTPHVATPTFSTSTAGSGMWVAFYGPHTSTQPYVAGWISGGATSTGLIEFGSTGGFDTNAAWTSLATVLIGATSTAHTMTINAERIWRQV
mgnify:CR=1 FL=1